MLKSTIEKLKKEETEENYKSHILIQEGGYIYIYGKCEIFEDLHVLKLQYSEENFAQAFVLLYKLNNNKDVAQVLYRHFQDIEKDDYLSHKIFSILKGETDGKT